jgi:hypothetical protein
MFSKRAAWRRALNQAYWFITEPRVLGIRLACLWAYARLKLWTDTRAFQTLSEADFRAGRKSERVFIFGSGASLKDIPPDEWAHMAEHDTFGFSMFVYQTWIRVDYHLLREMYIGQELNRAFWYPYSQEFAQYFDSNPQFAESVLIAQGGWRSLTVNRMLNLGLLRPRRWLTFQTQKREGPQVPSFRLHEGVVHAAGTLTDAINLAVIGGWKHIILAGVDLYDGAYFWEDQHANAADFGRDPAAIHNTVRLGIVEDLARWEAYLRERGVQLWVYNPRSLLREVLPLYDPQALLTND